MYEPFKQTPLGKADGATYGIPFYWGINPLVYRADLVEGEPDWSILFEGEKHKGGSPCATTRWKASPSPPSISASRRPDLRMDEKELAECKKACIAQKKLLRTYWNSIADLTNLFAAGEVVAFSSRSRPYDLKAKGIAMGLAKPKAGVIGWCDTLAIPKETRAKKAAQAYQLIDYLLGETYGTTYGAQAAYAQSTSSAPRQADAGGAGADLHRDLTVMDSFVWKANPPNYAQWVRIWNEVKAS